MVEKAQEIGLLVKSHSSSVGPGEERRLLEALNVKPVVVEKMDSPKTLARVEIKENGDTFNVKAYEKAVKGYITKRKPLGEALDEEIMDELSVKFELWMMLLKICSNKFKMQEFQLWIKMEIKSFGSCD